MEFNAYQIPQDNDLYIQQNLITEVSQNSSKDNFHIFASQSAAYTQMNGQNIFPTTTELGIELNHYFQTSLFCTYTFQEFTIDEKNNETIKNFWYCGNSLAVVPFASSVVHPKIKIYGGAGQAFGENSTPGIINKSIVHYFWALTPVVSAEVNISENFKFNIGAGYQLIMSDYKKLSDTSNIEGVASISYNFK
ncbi:hypothetical protein QEJ31_11830 [Pigmentibacter sp. JX0631]|uniref:hypothetical protein n=1 Tax=Pigmentibacter sp. JX0631 TaxID=2976982 RepID=UPI0024692503|nr:hypothetical protein [Pigmentibacter sp. JX0631]WGL59211.1 hypothetical protein QEJ31_11830 [Pigmentibacter sp. JX0631]